MSTVKISADTYLQEERALSAALRERNLLLAQAIKELKAMVAERDARIAALTDEIRETNERNEVNADGAANSL